jgi:thiaminase
MPVLSITPEPLVLPEALSQKAEGLLSEIIQDEFNQALFVGTLPPEIFEDFIRLDKIYLKHYGLALKQAMLCAPTEASKHQLKLFKADIISYETESLNTYLTNNLFTPNTPTKAGLNPLIEDYIYHVRGQDNYAQMIAALAPCLWLYASIGEQFYAQAFLPEHPYAAWIETYRDPLFREAVEQMLVLLNDCFESAKNKEERAQLKTIFLQSLQYETKLFHDVYETIQPLENTPQNKVGL